MEKFYNWEFLNEPLWRWFVFIVALSLIMVAWRAVLRAMQAAG